jgi:hypothetical protein
MIAAQQTSPQGNPVRETRNILLENIPVSLRECCSVDGLTGSYSESEDSMRHFGLLSPGLSALIGNLKIHMDGYGVISNDAGRCK